MQLTHLGPYSIDRPIGKGGMGSVYRGDRYADRSEVAIKALNPLLAAGRGLSRAVRGGDRIAQDAPSRRHRPALRLRRTGRRAVLFDGDWWTGSSLEDELKAGRRFDWREVTDIAIQLCGALKHAHDHGIIHRDIKPANILFADDRHVKLADFGIARLFGNDQQLTTAGGVLGTADYMSPEQADGRPVTARCDQYSLGRRDVRAVGGPAAVSREESAARCCSCSGLPSRSRCVAMRPTRRSNSKA